jgi:predicted metal-dependent hydrolase
MTKASALISPIDPQYTDHRDGEQRRRHTREWLRKRARAYPPPRISRPARDLARPLRPRSRRRDC